MAIEWEAAFASIITPVFELVCRSQGYVAMATAADRHGSLVWEAGREDTLNRYITYGITLLPAPHDLKLPHYAAEMWVGADNHERFTRRLLDHSNIAPHTLQRDDLLSEFQRAYAFDPYEPKKPWQDFLPLPGGIGPGDWSPNSQNPLTRRKACPLVSALFPPSLHSPSLKRKASPSKCSPMPF